MSDIYSSDCIQFRENKILATVSKDTGKSWFGVSRQVANFNHTLPY
ncbi:hypothetical protein OOU_Y34scaffold00116g5 [Pyricularia oryzae Y34]|uniref:Uncharacterized protein n=1 Tax=Pyricularia oryzae (strain Y34) TaxID=1143189 RepID=A0AA97PR33_PYRO3|nr:hypothetical protein OOU_Y34scaffold00116g5 [Pyricularia oryzae Y34]